MPLATPHTTHHRRTHTHSAARLRPMGSFTLSGEMIRHLATLMSATVAIALTFFAPAANADSAQDQQYLQLVHSNAVGGQDATLLNYAQEYCNNTTVDWGLVGELLGQIGVFNKAGIYVVQTAASRVYCPNKIVQPPPPPVYIDRY